MTQTNSENLIEHLKKKQNKILTNTELRALTTATFGMPLAENKFYKLTHQLKNRGYLYTLRKDIFLIKAPEQQISETALEEQFYRKLLKQHCQHYCKQDRYIGGMTALEIHLHGTGVSIPEEIIVFNKEKQAIETILLEKKVNFKRYEAKSKNLFPAFAKHTQNIKIKSKNISYANLELAILECLYNINPSSKGYLEGLILKAIKKFQKTIAISHFLQILKLGKHNSSINRLYTLLHPTSPTLAAELKNLIKKYGYFL